MSVGNPASRRRARHEVIASYPEWKHTPIILGESDPEGCAACQGSQNGYRNGPLYGVSVAEATMRTYELARKYGVTVEGAVTWAFEFEDQPAFAGFRELATNGIDKPVLNVFRMFGMLGGAASRGHPMARDRKQPAAAALTMLSRTASQAAPDVNAVATRNGLEWMSCCGTTTTPTSRPTFAQVHLGVDGLHGKAVTPPNSAWTPRTATPTGLAADGQPLPRQGVALIRAGQRNSRSDVQPTLSPSLRKRQKHQRRRRVPAGSGCVNSPSADPSAAEIPRSHDRRAPLLHQVLNSACLP
jgi:hypothetical protein